MRNLLLAGAILAASPALAAPASTPVDGETLNRIADQEFNHGEVMVTAEYLADHIGGRMTNSPAMRQAESWTQGRFRDWGLKNVHAEGFDFGRGWWIESSSVRVIAPRPIEVRAIPVAWTPATPGAVTAEIVVAPLRRERDFAAWKGKLNGKIVLINAPSPLMDPMQAPFERYSDADIAKLNTYRQPSFDPSREDAGMERRSFGPKLDAFLKAEGAVAYAKISRSDGRIVHGEGSGFKVGQTPTVPGFELGAEDYRRIVRLAKSGPVTLQVDSKVHYDDSDTKAYNIIADIPGSDPKAGYVMAGAHMDSWVAGDGAADNGAGVAVVMEAARILQSMGVKPKRTIRFALWSGEEEGLLGSWAYVDQHLAKRPIHPDPKKAALGPYAIETWPVTPLPGYKDMTAYFNIDNGSGKIRGIYAEGNFGAAPILRKWLEPFAPMGASAVVAEPTGSTDHVFMSRIGLPAFQFIQDPLDYESRVHHTDLDTFDHLRSDDLRQASMILAAMLLNAANADEPLPHNVIPTQPQAPDPYRIVPETNQ